MPASPLLGFRIIRCQSHCLFLEQDGVSPRERQSVWVFHQHSSYVDTQMRSLSLRAPSPADNTLVLPGPGSFYTPFLLFSRNGKNPNCLHYNDAFKGLVLWFEIAVTSSKGRSTSSEYLVQEAFLLLRMQSWLWTCHCVRWVHS